MTWEQKLAECKALTPTHLEMRGPGDWYVSSHLETQPHGRAILEGTYGNGRSPEEAVEDHWERITAPGHDIILDATSGTKRRRGRWNEYMWDMKPDPFDEAEVASRGW